MFIIQAKVDKSYQVSAKQPALYDFFADPKNFSRYMPDIIDDIEPQDEGQAIWKIKLDISSSTLKIDFPLVTKQEAGHKVCHLPLEEQRDLLAINIDMASEEELTEVNFLLELRLERQSSFQIHPLAGFLGERTISKLVQKHAEGVIDNFIATAAREAKEKKRKKK